LVAGASLAAAALGARYAIQAWQAFKARPFVPRAHRFYPGGFQQVMTRREAALILGIRLHPCFSFVIHILFIHALSVI